jgi:SAM-dependent methyltransferase
MRLGSPTHTMDKNLVTDIIQWDVRNWSAALEFWERSVAWDQVVTCLELGSKEGGLSLWMGLKGKSVLCTDVEDSRDRAREHHKKHHLNSVIEYAIVDATDMPFENRFDIITFKSVLGGIGGGGHKERQQRAIDEIHKALKPGGKLLFVENLAGSALHQWVRRRFIEWGDWWRYVTLDEMNQFLHRFTRVEMHTTGVLGTFGRSERQRSALGVVDQAILNRATPRRWQYLVYGIAEK